MKFNTAHSPPRSTFSNQYDMRYQHGILQTYKDTLLRPYSQSTTFKSWNSEKFFARNLPRPFWLLYVNVSGVVGMVFNFEKYRNTI